MGRGRSLGIIISLACLAGCVVTSRLDRLRATDHSPWDVSQAKSDDVARIEWEVVNRFRLLKGEEEEERFYRDLAAFIDEHRRWAGQDRQRSIFSSFLSTDLLHRPRSPFAEAKPNYQTHYDAAKSYRYDPAWVSDRRRLIEVRLVPPGGGFLPDTAVCQWTIGDRPAEAAKCAGHHFQALVDDATEVSVRRIDASPESTVSDKVVPRDITITAFGDSFSAGEGNPHSQWRIVTLQPQAAEWMDVRCHRSLMSGPSLTAAYIARHNPHASVTLLHYGCSGASIADGIVGPWAFLEPAMVVKRRYAFYDGLWGAPIVDRPKPITPADIAPGQIAQAIADLSQRAPDKRQPDIVLVSTGVNDIGFARIVTAFAARGGSADLSPGRVKDVRHVAPYDQAAWELLGDPPECRTDNDDYETYIACVLARVKNRAAILEGSAGPSPYSALDAALGKLTAKQRRVFISHYPSALTYADEKVTSDQDYKLCVDRPFDGRPGLIPGMVAWIPGLGIRKEGAAVAYSGVVVPLNNVISDAADKFDWVPVTEHVTPSRSLGLCSHKRFFNTLADSAFYQGVFQSAARLVGVARVRREGFHDLKVGDTIVWDPSAAYTDSKGITRIVGCYRKADRYLQIPDGEKCVLQTGPEREKENPYVPAMYEQQPKDGKIEFREPIGSSGTIHPTVYGHCAYAASILRTVLREFEKTPGEGDGLGLDPAFVAATLGEPGRGEGLTHDLLCKSRSWNFETIE